MTSSMRLLVAGLATLALGCAGLVALTVAGQRGVLLTAAVLVGGLGALAVMSRPRIRTRTTRFTSRAPAVHERFSRYEQLSSDLSWAMRERRHYDQVMRARLRDLTRVLAAESDTTARADEALRSRLGPEAWRWLQPLDAGNPTIADGQADPPTRAQLAHLLDRLESL